MSLSSCPNSQHWQLLLGGQLAEPAVESLYEHLDRCTVCVGLLGALASRSQAQSGQSAQSPEQAALTCLEPLEPRRRLGAKGRFELVHVIGRGGMGTVYSAIDRATDSRAGDAASMQVAIKLMRSVGDGLHRAERILRFKREFRAVQSLSHPNLVTLYELIQDGDELLLVMDLVPGQDLLTYLGRGRPSPYQYTARLRAVLPQIVSGLSHLHAAGIVHRDLKPANILVTPEGKVVILDFGLVAELNDPAALREGQVVGTRLYMAPEQAAAQAVTPAADWYSVGVLLYEAVTGERPGWPLGASEACADLEIGLLEPEAARALAPIIAAMVCPDPLKRSDGAALLRWARAAPTEVSTPMVPERPARAVAGAILEQPLFVGRTVELAQLMAALSAVPSRGFQSVIVAGESGIGKTALLRQLDEVIRRKNPDALVLFGRCSERESIPYQAVDGLIDGLSWALLRLPGPIVESLLPASIGILWQAFPVLRRVPAIDRAQAMEIADPGERSILMARALRELLRMLAQRYLMILLLDDTQWADADSLALLASLLAPPEPPRMLLVLAARSESKLPALPWPVERLSLGPLSAADSQALTEELLSGSRYAISQQTISSVVRESGGQPLFLTELLRRTVAGCDPAALSIVEVLVERIRSLPVELRLLLELSALAIRPQPHAVLSQLSGTTWPLYLRAVLTLRSERLLQTQRVGPIVAVEPYHDRVRQATLSMLQASELRTRHAELAAAIASHRASDYEAIAYHLQGAEEQTRAAVYYEQAGNQAFATLAFLHAAALYRKSLELRSYPAQQEAALRVRIGDSLANAGRGKESADFYISAAALLRTDEALRLKQRAAHQLLSCGHTEKGLGLLRDVLKQLGISMLISPPGLVGELTSVLYLMVLLLWLWGRGFDFRPRSSIDPREELRIEAYLSAEVHLGSVDYVLMLTISIRCLLIALDSGHERLMVYSLAYYLFTKILGSFGDLKEAHSKQLRFIEQSATRSGDLYLISICLHVRAQAELIAGRWANAVRAFRTVESLLVERCIGANWLVGSVRFMLAQALFFHGKLSELRRLTLAAQQEARERGDQILMTRMACGVNSVSWLLSDEPERAVALADETAQRVRGHPSPFIKYVILLSRVFVALYQGDGRSALALLRSDWPQRVARAIPLYRFTLRWLRALAVLFVAANSDDESLRRRLHRQADRDAAFLSKATLAWPRALGMLVRGVLAAQRAQRVLALVMLQDAALVLRSAALLAHAAAAQRRAGEVMGGIEGQHLISAADDLLRESGAQHPWRLIRILAPPIGRVFQ